MRRRVLGVLLKDRLSTVGLCCAVAQLPGLHFHGHSVGLVELPQQHEVDVKAKASLPLCFSVKQRHFGTSVICPLIKINATINNFKEKLPQVVVFKATGASFFSLPSIWKSQVEISTVTHLN